MRATLGTNYRMLLSNLDRISGNMYQTREQSVTGKRVNRPSDDPVAIRPILHYRSQIEMSERYRTHLEFAGGDLELLDSNLDQLENIMVRAKELGISAISGAANDQDRQTFADQIGSLFEEMMHTANAQINAKYVFSGFRENTAPFSENPAYSSDNYDASDSTTWPVIYNGDGNAKTIEAGPEKPIRIGLTGCELFLGDADNDQAVDADGIDLFAVLKNFEYAIRGNNQAGMNNGLAQLETGAEQVRRLRSLMGNNAQRIEMAAEQFDEASVEFKEILSSYEDANILEVFSRLDQQEIALEAALNVTAKVSRLSILDFM